MYSLRPFYKTIYNTTQKTKDPAPRTPLKTGRELKCSGRVHSYCSTCDTRRVICYKPGDKS